MEDVAMMNGCIRRGVCIGLATSMLLVGASMAQTAGRPDQAPGGAQAPSTRSQTNPYYVSGGLAGENPAMRAAPGTPGAVLGACRAHDAAACRTAMAAVSRTDSWTDCGRDLRCPTASEREAALTGCDRGQASSCDSVALWLSRKGYDSWKAQSD